MALPNETPEYRTARNALLAAEMELRRQIGAVAAAPCRQEAKSQRIMCSRKSARMKRRLRSDCPNCSRASRESCFIVSCLGRSAERPCPGCTHTLDCLDGAMRHVRQRLPVYIVAKSPNAPEVSAQHHRAGDLVDPVWGLLDMTPEGRGDFFPRLVY